MELTKEFVMNCRNVGALRDFLCQAMDQVDALTAENKRLNGLLNVWNTYKILGKTNNELKHNKYKRCLAMAWWCSAELGELVSTWEFKIKHYKKWQKRWLELAKQFKEAK